MFDRRCITNETHTELYNTLIFVSSKFKTLFIGNSCYVRRLKYDKTIQYDTSLATSRDIVPIPSEKQKLFRSTSGISLYLTPSSSVMPIVSREVEKH